MKMVNLKVMETSGVDHPAHLHEGWLVMKSADAGAVEAILDDVLSPSEEHAVSEQIENDEVTKTSEEALVEAQALIAALTAENEALKAASAEVTEEEVAEESIEDVAKSLPESLRKAVEDSLAKAAEATQRADAAEEALRKERDAQADAASVELVKSFSNLTLDADIVGPALRHLSEQNADLSKAIIEALTSVNAQAESAEIFKEIGRTAGAPAEGSAEERLNTLAKQMVDAGDADSFATAFTKAVVAHPDLYKQHLSEKG